MNQTEASGETSGKRGRGPRFSAAERARVEAEIVRLDAIGDYSQREIAGVVGVSVCTVNRVLASWREHWRQQAIWNTADERDRVLRELRMIKLEALAAYHRSRRERESVESQRMGNDLESLKTDKTGKALMKRIPAVWREKVKIDPRDGDMAPLRVYLECIKQERAVMGLDTPVVGAGRGGDEDAGSIQPNTYNVVIVSDKDVLEDWQQRYARQLETGENEIIDADDLPGSLTPN